MPVQECGDCIEQRDEKEPADCIDCIDAGEPGDCIEQKDEGEEKKVRWLKICSPNLSTAIPLELLYNCNV